MGSNVFPENTEAKYLLNKLAIASGLSAVVLGQAESLTLVAGLSLAIEISDGNPPHLDFCFSTDQTCLMLFL